MMKNAVHPGNHGNRAGRTASRPYWPGCQDGLSSNYYINVFEIIVAMIMLLQ